jgi:hypothetical protein
VSREGNEGPHGTDDSHPPLLGELQGLYEHLSREQRDELLQCLLIAAPRGGEAMVKVLEDTLLCHALRDLLGERAGHRGSKAGGSE